MVVEFNVDGRTRTLDLPEEMFNVLEDNHWLPRLESDSGGKQRGLAVRILAFDGSQIIFRLLYHRCINLPLAYISSAS